MLSELTAIVAPVFICAGIGYVWVKAGLDYEREFITNVAIHIATPALIFATLAKLQVTPSAFFEMAGLAVLMTLAMVLVGLAILVPLGWSPRKYMPSLLFGNSGNVGLPLCLFAFGQEGLSLGIAVFVIVTIAMFIAAPALAAGRVDWRQFVVSPTYYGIAAGIICMVFAVPLPKWLTNTVDILAGMAIPLMLVTLGASLAGLTLRSFARGATLAVVKIVAGLAVGLGLAALFGLTGAPRGVLIIQSAMPTAVFVYLFAARHDAVPDEVASVVLVSTFLSFVTLPLLLLIALP